MFQDRAWFIANSPTFFQDLIDIINSFADETTEAPIILQGGYCMIKYIYTIIVVRWIIIYFIVLEFIEESNNTHKCIEKRKKKTYFKINLIVLHDICISYYKSLLI